MNRRDSLQRLAAWSALGAALVVPMTSALAQEPWPNRPIKIVATFPAGGSSDLIARLLGPKLTAILGQPIVVENRPGGAGILGAEVVAKSPPDGYTLIMSTPGPHSIGPTLNPNIRYDAVAHFTHIALIGSLPHVLLTNQQFQAKTLKELVELSRSQPGRIDFASGGNGSINHIIGELFNTAAGISLRHIPYRGSAPATIDLRGNVVPLAVDALPANLGAIKSGELRALAITSATRSPMAPNIPTFSELGYPQLTVENWVGISGPAGMSDVITRRIADAVEKAMTQPEIRTRLAEWGVQPSYMGPGEFSAYVKADLERWRPVIIRSGAKVE